MKCKIPEISWHNRDPVLSVDIQPRSGGDGVSASVSEMYRLASGGTDAHVLIWYMNLKADGSDITLDLATDLTRHQRAVNVVKWSPNGELLASGDDESVIFIWKQKAESEPLNILETANEQDKEVWLTMKVLRGHMEDVYDLCWSPNSQFLVSGSVDNSAMIWDVQKGKSLAILGDHKGFVQGVAWDPKNQYIATLSTDRYLRIFDIQTKRVLYRVNKGTLPVGETHELHGKRVRLFHDDTLQTFFRRLSFTPDGKLLLTPAGVADYDGVSHPLHTTYIFSRYSLRQPTVVLPCPDQYTVAVRCCPLLFRLRPYNGGQNPPVVPLPYRMIFAVATRSSVYFYDTQQRQPFALISNIHYTRLTDITWSSDGRIVVVSSTDGFCSLISFAGGELGEVYEDSEAVLSVALSQETDTGTNAKKMKKPKENDLQNQKTQKLSTKESLDKVDNSDSPEGPFVEEEKQKNEMKVARPIAIKRKPSESAPIANKAEQAEKIGPKATPIAIKRKPGEVKDKREADPQSQQTTNKAEEPERTDEKEKNLISAEHNLENGQCEQEEISKTLNNPQQQAVGETKENVTSSKNKGPIIAPVKVLPVEMITDKEILSSDEKFESPEKKSRQATPIMVRRHPRTPNTQLATPTSRMPTSTTKMETDEKSSNSLVSSWKTQGHATPIAVRRTPRAIITVPKAIEPPTLVEEAMDAWPLDKDGSTKEEPAKDLAKLSIEPTAVEEEAGITPLSPGNTSCEHTEDIRLVYEETTENSSAAVEPEKSGISTVGGTAEEPPMNSVSEAAKQQDQHTPNNKTPRRVALKTISTPKSNRNLLD